MNNTTHNDCRTLPGVSAASTRLYLITTSYATLSYLVPCALWSAVVNVSILWVVAKSHRLQSPSNLLLCSLTLNDFLNGIVTQPLAITRTLLWLSADRFCWKTQVDTARSFCIHFYRSITLTTLVVISIDRYLAVSKLVYYKLIVTKQRVIRIVAAVWLLNIIITSVVTFALSDSSKYYMKSVPFAVLAGIVFCVQSAVVARVYAVRFNRAYQSGLASVLRFRVERRVAITVVLVLTVMLVSYVPLIAMMAVRAISGVNCLCYSSQWLEAVLYSNAAANSAIFIRRDSLLSKAVKDLMTYLFCVNRNEVGSTAKPSVIGKTDVSENAVTECVRHPLHQRYTQINPLSAPCSPHISIR